MIDNATYQKETLSERPIRQLLRSNAQMVLSQKVGGIWTWFGIKLKLKVYSENVTAIRIFFFLIEE